MKKSSLLVALCLLALAAMGFSATNSSHVKAQAKACCSGGACCEAGASCCH